MKYEANGKYEVRSTKYEVAKLWRGGGERAGGRCFVLRGFCGCGGEEWEVRGTKYEVRSSEAVVRGRGEGRGTVLRSPGFFCGCSGEE